MCAEEGRGIDSRNEQHGRERLSRPGPTFSHSM